ncbi:MAG TPA: thiamine pyrophosphate-dependent dehydrogenase E1 component subunit alpha [Anaerolineales bacterium]|jgi:TPP-dependent pyruvate/acetoin dehydrogenase alpha subunit|nr:thiamine pyrophosphate-dependent dehydrogenase E1 component subunit alpha [Anaerolineales bacterium]
MLTVVNSPLPDQQNEARDITEAFYRQMYTIRKVEQNLLDLFAQGYITGTVHTSMGQEACDVGVINALDRSKDILFSNHRAHGQFLAYCDDVEGLIAEIMGKETGVCMGIGGSQHIHKGNMYTNGVQGGIVPNAVGAALAEKTKRTGSVVTVVLGDGTMGEGVVYESLNIASLWSLPVLFLLIDNGIAQSTPKQLEHAGDLATRAMTFSIDSASIEADDVAKVYSTAAQIVSEMRERSRPFFLHVRTARLGPHSKGDDTRPKEEIELLRQRDPLLKIAANLPVDLRMEIEQKIDSRIQTAVEKAMLASHPGLEQLRRA